MREARNEREALMQLMEEVDRHEACPLACLCAAEREIRARAGKDAAPDSILAGANERRAAMRQLFTPEPAPSQAWYARLARFVWGWM